MKAIFEVEPMAQLRFLDRESAGPMSGLAVRTRALQQRCRIRHYDPISKLFTRETFEWRDVPTEVEEK
jgi:hypothetical protein